MDHDDYSDVARKALLARGGFDLIGSKLDLERNAFDAFCSIQGWPPGQQNNLLDPPDFILTIENRTIGVELTELVDEADTAFKQYQRKSGKTHFGGS